MTRPNPPAMWAMPAMPATPRERGVVALVVALVGIVVLGSAAVTVDIANLYRRRNQLQNAIDFGALAGSAKMPVNDATEAAAARAAATQVVLGNVPSLDASRVTVTFRCIVRDLDRDGLPDAYQVPTVCGPNGTTWETGWVSRGKRVLHACDPDAGDLCNGLVVSASDEVHYYFAPIFGIGDGGTGAVSAAGCTSGCVAGTSPVDIVLVFDRSASMTDSDMENARSAALNMLGGFDPQDQWVGLAVLPYGESGNPCNADPNQEYPKTDLSWAATPLSSDYLNSDNSLNTSSALVSTLQCLQKAWGITVAGGTFGHTDLGDPIAAAQRMLDEQGRAKAPDVIILFTDGEANQPAGMNPCSYAIDKAMASQNRRTEIFTIAYNVAGATCTGDTSGSYAGRYATTFLADMATHSTDDLPGGCADTENSDRDHYYCEPGNTNLTPVFRKVAYAAARNTGLVDGD